MADDSTNLHVVITGEAGSAVASGTQVLEILTKIEADLAKMGAAGAEAGAEVAAGQEAAAAGAVKHAEAETILGASLGRTETATNALARALAAFGVEAGAGAERVGLLAEAVDGLGKSMGPLIIIGAAILGIAEAFNVLGESVKAAADVQATLASIKVAVQDQGGNWTQASASIDKFLESLEGATTYSKAEGLSAINELTSAGVSLSDSERLVALATDIAAAKHKSLAEVVDDLKNAELGRSRGLESLDDKIKAVVQSHGHLSDALAILSSEFSGQASAATDTFTGKQKQLQNAFEAVEENIGKALLPALTEGLTLLLGFAQMAEGAGSGFGNFIRGAIDGARLLGRALSDLTTIMRTNMDLAGGNVGDIVTNKLDAGKALGDLASLTGAGLDMGGGKKFDPLAGSATGISAFDAIIKQAQDAGQKAREEFDKNFRDKQGAYDNDPVLGEKKPKAPGTPYDYFDPDSKIVKGTDPNDVAQAKTIADLKAMAEAEGVLKNAISDAVGPVEKERAEMALATAERADAIKGIIELGTLTDGQKNQIATLTTTLAEQVAAQKAAQNAMDNFGHSLQDTTPTKAQTEEMKNLKHAYDESKTAVTTTAEELSKLKTDVETNTASLAKYYDQLDAVNKLEAKEANDALALVAAWDKQVEAIEKATIAEKARRAEAEVDQGQTLQLYAAKAFAGGSGDTAAALQVDLAFYQQRYAVLVAADQQFTAEGKAAWDKMLSLEGDIYKQRIDASVKYVAEVRTAEIGLLDDILTKHRSMKDELLTIYDDIKQYFIKMVEEMLVKSALFTTINQNVAGIFGGAGGVAGIFGGGGGGVAGPGGGASPGGALAQTVSGAGSGGLIGSLVGQAGAQQVAAALPTSSIAAAFMGQGPGTAAASAQLPANTSGSSLFGGAGDASGMMTGPGGSSATNAGGTASGSGLFGGGSSFITGGLAKTLGGIGMGMTLGGTFNSMLGGNQENGTIGSALGAGVGAIGGPLGSVIGGALGGIVGGLFGSHATAAKDPDIFDTQNFGQGAANLMGTQFGANGQAFYLQQGVSTATGGTGEIAFIEKQLAGATSTTGPGGAAGYHQLPDGTLLNPQQYQQYLSTFGESATGSGKLVMGTNIGQQYVSGAQGASSSAQSYATLDNLAAQFMNMAGSGGASSSLFSMSRSYPTYAGTLSGPLGTTMSGVNGVPTGSPSLSAVPSTWGKSALPAGGVVVQVDLSNTTIVGSVPDTIINQISTKLQDILKGIVPGAVPNGISNLSPGN